MRWSWLITLPLTVLAVIFAVMNRDNVRVELWPWPWDIEMPLFLLVAIALFLGFLIGAAAMWFSGSGRRRQMRDLARRSAEDARALREMRASAGKTTAQSTTEPVGMPRLPGPA